MLPSTKEAEAYLGLLIEIKYRTEAIRNIVSGQIPLRARIAEETCFLQLRLICELIALGCLLVHHDVPTSKVLQKAYQADFIMNGLSKLLPAFYPVPIQPCDRATSGKPPEQVHIEDGFLTKADLKTLYNERCGAVLHRGTLRNILAKSRDSDFQEIERWHFKIVTLLNRHNMATRDGKHFWHFQMNAAGELPTYTLFERVS